MSYFQDKYFLFLRKVISLVFLFFVFFPFVAFFKTGTDMQPYSVVCGIFLFPFFKFKITKSQMYFFFLVLIAFLLLFFSDFSFNSFRSLYNYISLFIIYYVSFRILSLKIVDIESIIKIFLSVWIIVGFLQATIKKDLFTFLISESRTTDNRGVTSLAPEPTFFAIVLIFFILFIYHLNLNNSKKYFTAIIFSILLLAKSSMGIFYLLILFLYIFITNFNLRLFLFTSLTLFLLGLSFSFFSDTRLYQLSMLFIENPFNLLILDASVNDRFFQIFFSIKGFFQFYFFPHGFSLWSKYLAMEVPKYADYVLVDYFSSEGRIMSGLGSLLFELGLFGLLMPIMILNNNIILFRDRLLDLIFVTILVLLLLISAIPIGFSYFGFYLALNEYLKSEKKKTLFSTS
jgi:hypothetical protein